MGRKYTKKITRAAKIDPYQSLAKFYKRQVGFLEREKKRVTKFFKNNNIQGDSLSVKLAKLQLLIDEGVTNKARIQGLLNNLYERETEIETLKDTIKNLTKERDDFKKRCSILEAIDRARTNNRNLYEQQLAYSRQLTNQGLVRATPVLQRTESGLNLESELEPFPAHRKEDMDLLGRFLYIPDETNENSENRE
ncbi:30571_t:CDS:2 [Gigaspora margarita]|uniref:30571_t:CDS:1 n=1 Tax=Gigaspora margarita TaxID=4874 RepID=A0ABN7ULP2_GIGMA|nr:30571_t:CDS:2 [Gigaspora margarita]